MDGMLTFLDCLLTFIPFITEIQTTPALHPKRLRAHRHQPPPKLSMPMRIQAVHRNKGNVRGDGRNDESKRQKDE